jgi:serine/threonine protein phosphatase PrpC
MSTIVLSPENVAALFAAGTVALYAASTVVQNLEWPSSRVQRIEEIEIENIDIDDDDKNREKRRVNGSVGDMAVSNKRQKCGVMGADTALLARGVYSRHLQQFILTAQANCRLEVGCGSWAMQGRRDHMEDCCTMLLADAVGQLMTAVGASHHLRPSDFRLKPAASKSSVAIGFNDQLALLAADDEMPLVGFFGVYDGHGGPLASEFVARTLHSRFARALKRMPSTDTSAAALLDERADGVDCYLSRGVVRTSVSDASVALERAIVETDRAFLSAHPKEARRQGTTAIVAVVVGATIVAANVGDSRAVLGRFAADKLLADADYSVSAVDLSDDHKPNRADEYVRVEEAGGIVRRGRFPSSEGGSYRVYDKNFRGGLAMSRAIGDSFFKKRLVAELKLHASSSFSSSSSSPSPSPSSSSLSSSSPLSSPSVSPTIAMDDDDDDDNESVAIVAEPEDKDEAEKQKREEVKRASRRRRRRNKRRRDLVIATPEMHHERLFDARSDSAFVILASDGLWDVMSSQSAVDFVASYCARHQSVEPTHSEIIARLLVEEAYSLGSSDNITASVLFFTSSTVAAKL